MTAKYPNLELMEYQFRQMLEKSDKWKNKMKKKQAKTPEWHVLPEYDILVFPQMWSSTCTAFDRCEDGSPVMAGCAMTKAYTVVIEELKTETFGVFVDGRPCYMVDEPNDTFYKDLDNKNMKGLSDAMKSY